MGRIVLRGRRRSCSTSRLTLDRAMSAYPKRGEVYFVDLRGSQGSEQQGIRPALVVSTNLNNQFSSVITVIPITHTIPKRLFAQNVLIAAGLLDAVPNTAYCGQNLINFIIRQGKDVAPRNNYFSQFLMVSDILIRFF